MNGHLSQEQLNGLRSLLEDQLARLKEDIRGHLLQSDNEYYIEIAGRVHDLGDESVADLVGDINLILIDHLVQEIGAVEQALMRMPRGDYGVCVDCGEDIRYERLKAEPYALRCVGCQRRHEKEYMSPGEPSI